MGNVHDITGRRFGRLTVIHLEGRNKHGSTLWLCRCDCGTEKIIDAMCLKAKKSVTRSCGCHRAEAMGKGREALHRRNRRHGKSRTREHHIWQNMIYRCQKEDSQKYPHYGGRGIMVCERWQGPDGFAHFLEDVGLSPSPQHTLDRFPDNNGPYAPGNVRWATKKEQGRNRRDNQILEYQGERKLACEWCALKGIHKATLSCRLKKGWTVAEALETRPGARRK